MSFSANMSKFMTTIDLEHRYEQIKPAGRGRFNDSLCIGRFSCRYHRNRMRVEYGNKKSVGVQLKR